MTEVRRSRDAAFAPRRGPVNALGFTGPSAMPARLAAYCMVTRFALAAVFFGSTSSSTPSLYFALALT